MPNMLFLFITSALTTTLAGNFLTEALDIAQNYDVTACTDENKTYTLDLKIHAQDFVVKALNSIANSAVGVIQGEDESVEAYFGTIIDELNEYLIRFKVQLHLNLDAYNTDNFMGNVTFDKSCERESPVEERTNATFEHLKESFKDNIGLHLFVWVCPFVPNNVDLITVLENKRCGRIMGVMWKGTQETRALIKSVILNALTGGRKEYISDSSIYDREIGPRLCDFATSCIGIDSSQIGQEVLGTEVVKYTNKSLITGAP